MKTKFFGLIFLVLGGCASLGNYGIQATGSIQYHRPEKQEILKVSDGLQVTNWSVDENSGLVVKKVFVTQN